MSDKVKGDERKWSTEEVSKGNYYIPNILCLRFFFTTMQDYLVLYRMGCLWYMEDTQNIKGGLKMRRITTCLLLVLLSCATVPKEVSRKLISNTDGTKEYVFYSEGEEITKQIVKDGSIIKTTGKIPDGIVKEYYKSEQLETEWNYKNNKLEDISKQYYKSGALMAEKNFRDGKREGMSKRYYESGTLLSERNFKDGKLEGIEKQYYESGALFSVSNYKDGKEEGKSIMYDENGMLSAELNYRNSQLDGISNIYDADGNLRIIETYKNGKRIKRKEYDEKGNQVFEKNYTIDKEKK